MQIKMLNTLHKSPLSRSVAHSHSDKTLFFDTEQGPRVVYYAISTRNFNLSKILVIHYLTVSLSKPTPGAIFHCGDISVDVVDCFSQQFIDMNG